MTRLPTTSLLVPFVKPTQMSTEPELLAPFESHPVGVTLPRIAKALGCSAMALYRYVGSKEALWSLMADLAISLKCIISQRLVKNLAGGRSPTVEVLMNTQNIADLINEGRVSEIKEAMEKSLTPGSQTFEQDLFRLIKANKISVEEGMNNADWRTLVDEIFTNGNAADLNTIGHLLRLNLPNQEAEAVAARSNMTRIVRMLHDPSSQMMDMLLAALK